MATAKSTKYYVAAGFNIGVTEEDQDGTRFDVGTDAKPNLVEQKDFDKAVWDDLRSAGAILPVEDK